VHVITSNTQVLGMVPRPKVTVTALGGDYLPDIGSVAGTMTDRQLEDLYFDRAFIGVTGIDADAGVTTFDIREANKKRLVQAHSRETVVLADSSKFDVVSLCRLHGRERPSRPRARRGRRLRRRRALSPIRHGDAVRRLSSTASASERREHVPAVRHFTPRR
jgi:hypothetical protein